MPVLTYSERILNYR